MAPLGTLDLTPPHSRPTRPHFPVPPRTRQAPQPQPLPNPAADPASLPPNPASLRPSVPKHSKLPIPKPSADPAPLPPNPAPLCPSLPEHPKLLSPNHSESPPPTPPQSRPTPCQELRPEHPTFPSSPPTPPHSRPTRPHFPVPPRTLQAPQPQPLPTRAAQPAPVPPTTPTGHSQSDLHTKTPSTPLHTSPRLQIALP